MVVPSFVVGFSGHRNLSDSELIGRGLTEVFRMLETKAKASGGTLVHYGSIAYGADILAAEAARDLDIPVHLILPKSIETADRTGDVQLDRGFPLDFWDEISDSGKKFRQEDWDRAWVQIEEARDGSAGGSLRLVNGSQTDPECYYDAGMQVLEACDVFVAVWNGQSAQGLGGTAEMVEIARAIGKPLVVVDAGTGETSSERLEAFASKPDSGLDEIEKINQLIGDRCGEKLSGPEMFTCLDTLATVTAKQFRSSLVWAILFHGVATVIAAFAAILPADQGWSAWMLFSFAAVEMVLVSYALYLSQIQAWRHNHEKWLRARFAAELVRGLESAISFLDPLTPQITRHAPRWRKFAVSMGLLANRGVDRSQAWTMRRDAYVKDRLEDQVEHYLAKQGSAATILSRTQLVAKWATWLAPVVVLGALIYKFWHALDEVHGEVHFTWTGLGNDTLFLFLPIFVPLIAGMATGLQAALDATRRTHRYKEVAERLRFASKGLVTVRTETGARNTIAGTEEVLLDELIEWNLAEEQNTAH